MKKKRIIGAVIIKDNIAVQAFKFSNYLPLGSFKCLVENLDRWQIDEIALIDISNNPCKPNLDLLKSVSILKITTPLIYGGKIKNSTDAIDAIRYGADRIIIGVETFFNQKLLIEIMNAIGSQAIIASIPIIMINNNIYIYNYQTKEKKLLDNKLLKIINASYASEVLISDVLNDGIKNSFNFKLLKKLNKIKVPLILFGGISEAHQVKKASKFKNVSAVAIGNFLSYKEHAYQKILSNLPKNKFRKPYFKI